MGEDALPYSQCEGEDEDADVVEEDDGHEGVHVVLHVTGGGELFGDEGFPADMGMDKALHEPVEEGAEEGAYKEAYRDIAQIVDSEIETGEGGGE